MNDHCTRCDCYLCLGATEPDVDLLVEQMTGDELVEVERRLKEQRRAS